MTEVLYKCPKCMETEAQISIPDGADVHMTIQLDHARRSPNCSAGQRLEYETPVAASE